MRLSVRVEDDLAAQIEGLARSTGRSLSQLVKEALHYFYQHVATDGKKGLRVLEKSGFIGIGRTDATLSTAYKQHFGRALKDKL